MPKFKTYNQDQMMLLPPSLADCLPKDHLAFLIDEVVNGLELRELEKSYSENGCPAYDPRLMIKILFYGHTQGITSSRKLEKACYENNAFRFLAASQLPDHGTISLFRKNHLANLPLIFSQIVILCDRLDMVDLTDISIDGTKVKASASRSNLFSQEQIDKLKEKIGKALEEAVKLDEEEDRKFGERRGYNQIPEKLLDPEKRKKAIAEAKRRLKELEKAGERIKVKQAGLKTREEKEKTSNATSHISDPDANLMKMKDKSFKMAYNVQFASSRQVITGYEVNNDATDYHSFIPMTKETEKNTGKKVEKIKADSGYFSKENLEFCQAQEIEAYIPDEKKALEERQERKNEIPKYDRRNFHYDLLADQFICPEGRNLVRRNPGEEGAKRYIGKECRLCPVRSQCTKSQCRNLTYDFELEKMIKEMREKLNSEEGKNKYLERLPEIEPIFGNLKHNLGFTKFLTQGKPMVLIETGLHACAHNLVKIFNHLRKKKQNETESLLNTLTRLQTQAAS